MRSLSEKLAVAAFGIAVLIFTAAGILSYWSTEHLIATFNFVTEAQESLDQVDKLLVETLEVESAVRGYVVTGQDFYLEPYYVAMNRIGRTLTGLKDIGIGNPVQQEHIKNLQAAVEEKLAYHRDQIKLRSSAGFDAARDTTGRGHALMDQVRGLAESVKFEENRELSRRESEAKLAAQWSIYSLILGAIISFAILFSIYLHLNKEIRRRKKTEANLIQLGCLHLVLIQVGKAIALSRGRDRLFREVCRAAVDRGLFVFAWIGSYAESANVITAEVQQGEDAVCRQGIASLFGTESGFKSVSGDLRHGGHFVCNDTRQHPLLADAKGPARSMTAFPLFCGNQLSDVLVLCAPSPGFFDAGTLVLLDQIASDLSFALETIALEVKRRLAEEQIKKLNEELEHRVGERTEQLAVANAELALRNREVERANRLKSEFLANMSHELRTPLNAIIGFSDLLMEERAGTLQQKQKHFVGHIQAGARHLLQLINDILDISKIEAGRIKLDLESFKASTALAEVLSVITPLAVSKRIEVEEGIADDVVIHADRIRFKQVLYNLISNAVKFTPEEGKVRIASHRGENGELRFSVCDTGVGIPPHEQTSIFTEFHQVGGSAGGNMQGTGLGLSITKRLIELHGGAIWLESEPEKGTTFFFTVPTNASRESAGAANRMVAGDGRSGPGVPE